ncbi:hypothetical protein BpHYR1_008167 [Brachionus plicatilis]|uniref:Uncharacterized protein n=1 Tax=Brachionus plicatilis TaxID=10195 RepID=A0A3M7PRA0_BRAPC|nr:hypothetical protein BpHYR1_008167 [Brachionus plicatilis]
MGNILYSLGMDGKKCGLLSFSSKILTKHSTLDCKRSPFISESCTLISRILDLEENRHRLLRFGTAFDQAHSPLGKNCTVVLYSLWASWQTLAHCHLHSKC